MGVYVVGGRVSTPISSKFVGEGRRNVQGFQVK
jgi:hypothetical protein